MRTGFACLMVLATFLGMVSLEMETATAGTIYVGNGGGYASIQEAVDAADDGDIIFVYTGVYVESLVIYKVISLIGENKHTTVIDGAGNSNVIRVTKDWVNISGFTIINGDSGINLGVSSYCEVANNIVTDNTNGIYLASTTNEISGNNTIVGNNASANDMVGIHVQESSNNTIANNTASYNDDYGIHISWKSNDNVILNNTASYNGLAGIRTFASVNNRIADNTMIDNGIFVWGSLLEHFNTHSIDTSNTVNRKPVYYWKNVEGGIVPLGAGEVILANCTDVTIENQIMRKSSVGVMLAFSNRTIVENITASHEGYGVYVYESTNSIIQKNTFSTNEFGIILGSARNNSISNNTVFMSTYRGIHFYLSDGNIVFHNNFIDNAEQAYDDSDTNQWDDAYPSGGNYWSDYAGVDICSGPNQDVCPDPDGLGDSAFVIDADSRDRYPLMSPPLPLPPFLPTEPQNFQVTGSDQQVTLTWEAPAFDGGSPISNYMVYRGLSSSGKSYLTTVTNIFTHIDTGLTNGLTYFYQISAVNGVGEGPKSNEADATPATVPDAPRELKAEGGQEQIALSWLAPLDDGGSLITNYRIYRGNSSGEETYLAEVGDVLAYVDSALENGRMYFYAVSAVNHVGEGGESNEANASIVNQRPNCIISAPTSGETISGSTTIVGSASDLDGAVQRVEIRFDNGTWLLVNGTENWSYGWNTEAVSNGDHAISARSFDGVDFSDMAYATITIDNNGQDGGAGKWLWILVLLLIVVVSIILMFLILLWRRKRDDSEEEEEPPQ